MLSCEQAWEASKQQKIYSRDEMREIFKRRYLESLQAEEQQPMDEPRRKAHAILPRTEESTDTQEQSEQKFLVRSACVPVYAMQC